jgi:hypothetical protein
MSRPVALGAASSAGLAAIGAAWHRFWFTPADGRPLALVRIGAGIVALAAWWSYAGDLRAWFGPEGVLPVDVMRQWRPQPAFSLFDFATTGPVLGILFMGMGLVFLLLLLGVVTPLTAPLAAVLWASLLHRGPMLAGPGDDCLAVLLWCLVMAPAGAHLSVDRWLAARAGRPAAGPSTRAAVASGLVRVHATAITLAALVAQAKEPAWWDGLAAWQLAAAPQSRCGFLVPLLERSEYLTNFLTHAITAFELVFAIGLWWAPARRAVARLALVAWPLVGLLAGEPLWGCAMAVFALPSVGGAQTPSPDVRRGATNPP